MTFWTSSGKAGCDKAKNSSLPATARCPAAQEVSKTLFSIPREPSGEIFVSSTNVNGQVRSNALSSNKSNGSGISKKYKSSTLEKSELIISRFNQRHKLQLFMSWVKILWPRSTFSAQGERPDLRAAWPPTAENRWPPRDPLFPP